MAERRGQYPQGEAGEAASVTAVREYAHEESADVTGSFVLHEPPWYGTVCPVVWEDGGSNPASYPMVPDRRVCWRRMRGPYGIGPPGLRATDARPLRCWAGECWVCGEKSTRGMNSCHG